MSSFQLVKRFLMLGTGVLAGLACGGEVPDSQGGGIEPETSTASLTSNATVPGTVSFPFPTVSSLTIEWPFTGDLNANGGVTFRYRKVGTTTWRQGMPLRRIPAGSNGTFTWGDRHSGSMFDLDPISTYELELTLTDPDGGSTVRTATATTRPIPAPMAGAPVKSVTPATLDAVAASAQPGDIIEFGPGNYHDFVWRVDGTADKPIVLRGLPDAVMVGQVDLRNRSYVQFVQLIVYKGRIRIDNSRHVAIRRSTIYSTTECCGADGIIAHSRAENAYIADNVLNGTMAWEQGSLGENGTILGEGIVVTGPGHVIRNNRVTGYRDGISLREGTSAADQYSIDILQNDLISNLDDGIEADYCFHNCRVMRNRLTNNFVAISAQPTLGGPHYVIRNVIYNAVLVPFKLHGTSTGDVLLHNTVVKNGDAFAIYSGSSAPVTRLYSRNNLFIGGPGGTYGGSLYMYSNGNGKVMDLRSLDVPTADLDYDGFGSTTGTFTGWFGGTSFSSLSALRSGTTEKNAIQVDLGVFSTAVAYPSAPMTLYAAPDLRIRSDVPAADAGQVIPAINDGFTGTAPALGAHEPGATPPVYGPR
jgi:hypothetical protein